MSSYSIFAHFYDRLTENVDYEVRSNYISDFFKTNKIATGTILDLACGTCSMSLPFVKNGFRLIGIDVSEEMLSAASEKLLRLSDNFSLVKADMTNFCLSEKADGCICTLDSINHLTDEKDVEACFQNVYHSLKKDGLFVFDVNTIYKHNEILGDNTFVFDEEDFFLSWDNELDENDTVRILLDFFIFNGHNYDRFSEVFSERAYPLDLLKNMLIKIGFKNVMMYDELTYDFPKSDSQRVFFVCKR